MKKSEKKKRKECTRACTC